MEELRELLLITHVVGISCVYMVTAFGFGECSLVGHILPDCEHKEALTVFSYIESRELTPACKSWKPGLLLIVKLSRSQGGNMYFSMYEYFLKLGLIQRLIEVI